MDIYIGKLKKMVAKSGKEYFKGFVGNVPVVCFWGHKEPDSINVKLDAGYVKYLDEKEDEPQTEKPAAAQQDDDLPF